MNLMILSVPTTVGPFNLATQTRLENAEVITYLPRAYWALREEDIDFVLMRERAVRLPGPMRVSFRPMAVSRCV